MSIAVKDANGATQTIATADAIVTALGTPMQQTGGSVTANLGALNGAATATGVAAVATALAGTLAVDTVVKAATTDRGASVGTAASQLMAANTARRGFAIQNQSSTAKIYISGQTTATADYHSLMIPPLGYYETPPGHVSTGVISIISDTAATSVYAREW